MALIVTALLFVAAASAQGFFGCTLGPQTGITTSLSGYVTCFQGTQGAPGVAGLACYASIGGSSTTNITAAHLHAGATISANGPPVFYFSIPATPPASNLAPFWIQEKWVATSANYHATTSGTFTSDVAACAAAGGCYFNVHTEAHGGGEAACELQPTGTAGGASVTLTQTLGGESPTDAPTATGSVALTFGSAVGTGLNAMGYQCSFNGLSGPVTAAHIHDSSCNSNACSGSPFIYFDFSGGDGVTSGSFFGVLIEGKGPAAGNLNSKYQPGLWYEVQGGTPFAANNQTAFDEHGMQGFLYFNVHTALHPGGELRANIGVSGASSTAPAVFLVAALISLVKIFA